MARSNQIDSHSSFINNKRIIEWFAIVDTLGLKASNSLHLSEITAYYNSIEEIYFNVESIVMAEDRKKFNDLMANWRRTMALIDNYPHYRTKKALYYLLNIAKDFKRHVIAELQHGQFFFRVSDRPPKGLSNVLSLAETYEQIQRDLCENEESKTGEERGQQPENDEDNV